MRGALIRVLARIRALVSNPIGILAILLVALVVLFLVLRGDPFVTGSTTPRTPNQEEAREKTIGLAINEGKMSPAEATVAEGERVTLLIASDRSVEFHIDGLGVAEAVEPLDEPVEVSFEASTAGRFAMEDRLTDAELGILYVQPR